MSILRPSLTLCLGLTIAILASKVTAHSPSSPADDPCSGCVAEGNNISSTTYCSAGAGADYIKISISIISGVCKTPIGGGPCTKSPCSGSVLREWKLPAGHLLNFCTQIGSGHRDCREPKPVASGGDESDSEPFSRPCDGVTQVFTISGVCADNGIVGPIQLDAKCTNCDN